MCKRQIKIKKFKRRIKRYEIKLNQYKLIKKEYVLKFKKDLESSNIKNIKSTKETYEEYYDKELDIINKINKLEQYIEDKQFDLTIENSELKSFSFYNIQDILESTTEEDKEDVIKEYIKNKQEAIKKEILYITALNKNKLIREEKNNYNKKTITKERNKLLYNYHKLNLLEEIVEIL